MSSRQSAALAAALYTVLTLVLTFPLILHLGSLVPSDPGDPLLNTWVLWWNAHAFPLTSGWWNGPAFYPAPDALTLSEHLFGLSLLTTPIIRLTGNPQLGYNVVFLLTFILSALSAYALGFTLTKRHDAALVAGLVYGFAPYRMTQFAHIQVLASFWMPLALVGLHKFVEDGGRRWLALFGVAVLMQGLTNGYYLLFFPVLLGLWLLWFLPRGQRLPTLLDIGGTFVVASLPLVPFLLHYYTAHEQFGLTRGVNEMAHYSADLADFIHASGYLSFWGGVLPHAGPEADVFPGLTVVLLIVAGLIWRRRPARAGDSAAAGLVPRWLRMSVAGLAVAFSLAALSVLVVGPWKVELFGFLISAQRLSRPLSQAAYLWLFVALTGPGVRRLVTAQSPFAFYVSATLVIWVLCLGPAPSLHGEPLLYWAPYRWLTLLPGYDGLRVPARFTMLAMLCLAAAGSLALARLLPRFGRRGQVALIAIVSLGVLVDGWRTLPLVDPPTPSILKSSDAPGPVVELPIGKVGPDVAAMYRGMSHGHPVVNGYSGYSPPHYDALALAAQQFDPSVLEGLATIGLRYIVINRDRDPAGHWVAYVDTFPAATLVRTAGDQRLYEVTRPAAAPAARPFGRPIAVAGVVASVAQEDAPLMFDHDVETRWSTGEPQRPGESLVLDLLVASPVTGVELALGPSRTDFPRLLVVEGSTDGARWTELWRGPTGGLTVAGLFVDAERKPIRVLFAPAKVRYLRLRQLGLDPVYYWSIAELTVLAPPG